MEIWRILALMYSTSQRCCRTTKLLRLHTSDEGCYSANTHHFSEEVVVQSFPLYSLLLILPHCL